MGTVASNHAKPHITPYGERCLDSRPGRWLSADPALGDYIPGAPVDDEARQRNGSLPGMDGVFNSVNLHFYHVSNISSLAGIANSLLDAAMPLMNNISSNNANSIQTTSKLDLLHQTDSGSFLLEF